jgi:hypothetical protein
MIRFQHLRKFCKKKIPLIQKSKGVIFDVRGYPDYDTQLIKAQNIFKPELRLILRNRQSKTLKINKL